MNRLSAATSIRLRPASIADLPLLQRWDEEPQIVAAKGSDDWGWEAELQRNPDWREQLIAEADGKPVGFIQIIDPCREDGHYWGCTKENQRAIDIWIGDAADLGHGYGTEMMKLAIKLCFADPAVTAVLVDPRVDNPRAQRFYERLGFEYVARRRFGEDDCFVYRLKRPAGESKTA